MARRRYISTNISVDKAVNKLAEEYGDFAALLYTWMIPHAADDGSLTGDPEELLMMIVPGRRSKTADDVSHALSGMESLGLIIWDKPGNKVYFPGESFYKYQTYISEKNRRTQGNSDERRKTPQNAEEHREPAQKAASPSPSFSPSPSLSPSPSGKNTCAPDGAECASAPEPGTDDAEKPASGEEVIQPAGNPVTADDAYPPEFEEFWLQYPRRVDKGKAFRCWKARLKSKRYSPGDLIAAAMNYAAACDQANTEKRYIKHPATFLGPDLPFKEWITGPPEPPVQPRGSPKRIPRAFESLLNFAKGDGGDVSDKDNTPGTNSQIGCGRSSKFPVSAGT